MSERVDLLLGEAMRDGLADFSTLAWPAGLRAMVLAPHSDDFDAVAVTLEHLRDNGALITLEVLCLDNGVSEDYEPGTPQADIRKREQIASLRFFGQDLSTVRFPEMDCDDTGQVYFTEANVRRVQAMLAAAEPEMVFLPHVNDTNTGHQAAGRLLAAASERAGTDFGVCMNHDPKTIAMTPNAYTPFDEAKAAWKREMLRCHDSQHQRNLATRGRGFDDRILDDDAAGAKTLGLDAPYAEMFEICPGGRLAALIEE